MGLVSGVIRCFCCDLKDEYQQNEQEPELFPINHDAPTDTLHDQNGLRVQECQDYLSKLSAEPFGFSCVQNDLQFRECLDYNSDSSSSDSLQQQVLIYTASFSSCENSSIHGTFQQHQEAAGLPCLLDSTTLVDESEFVEVTKQDADLLEEMYCEEPNEEVQDGCLLEELHFELPIEKKQGAYLLEVVLFKELIAKKQDVCSVEGLHLKEPELIAKKQDVCSVEGLQLKEPELIAKKQDVCSVEGLQLKEPELIAKNQDVCSVEALHLKEPELIAKKQDVCSVEGLQLKEPELIAKNQDVCSVEDLHLKEPELIAKKQDVCSVEELQLKEPELIAKKQDVCFVEELQLKEPELIAKNQDVCFVEELHLKEPELMAKKQDVCFVEELHLKEPIEKTQDARFLLEKLHFEEPVEKKQGVCLREDLHCEKPIKEEVMKNLVAEERWIKHYSSSQKILLVGEGDFSFSASLAKAFGSAHNMTATSLDSKEFLRENYRRVISNIENLTNKGCRVIHGVDAKVMAKNPLLKGMKFDRIVFNFPFAGFFKEFPREYQLRKHRRLVSRFLKNAKEMIKQSGEIHVTHKTNNFHSEWNIEQLASCHGLRLAEAVDFRHRDFPGYMTMRGFGGDNFFFCYPCKTHKFGLQIAHGPKKSRRKRRIQTAR